MTADPLTKPGDTLSRTVKNMVLSFSTWFPEKSSNSFFIVNEITCSLPKGCVIIIHTLSGEGAFTIVK